MNCFSIFLMISACVHSIASTSFFNFIDMLQFYICFWAQRKFCSTPHLISHFIFYSLHAAHHPDLLGSSLPLSQHLCISPPLCVCLDKGSCCHSRLVFRIIRVWLHLTQLLFPLAPSPSCHLKEASAPLLILQILICLNFIWKTSLASFPGTTFEVTIWNNKPY